MRDPLKDFIGQHRPELDACEPSPELWTKIETTMNFTPAVPAQSISWLKYFTFGASAIAIGFVVYQLQKQNPSATRTSENRRPVTQEQAAAEWQEEIPAAAKPAAFPAAQKQPPANPETVPAAGFVSSVFPVTEEKTPEVLNTCQSEPRSYDMGFISAPLLPAGQSRHMEGNTIQIDTLFTGITRLEVSGSSFDVDIKSHQKPELQVKGVLETKAKGVYTNKAHYELEFRRVDTVLYVTVVLGYEKNKQNQVVIMGSVRNEAKLNFTVPEKLNVVIRDQYGDASVAGLRGNVCDVSCSSGNVSLSDIGCGVKAGMTYGDFTAKNIRGNVQAKISSGSAVIHDVEGNVEVTSTYGDQKIKTLKGNLRAVASSGAIHITGMTGDAYVRTTYGDIGLEDYKGTPDLSASSGAISGKEVELTGNTRMSTTYGDISMTLANAIDALQFDLRTTYGDILVDKNGKRITEENKLQYGSGGILIKATTSSGSQVYR